MSHPLTDQERTGTPGAAAPSRPEYFRVRRSVVYAFVALAVGLLFVDAVSLKRTAYWRALSQRRLEAQLPPVGRVVPPLLGTGPHGKSVVVGYGKGAPETALFVFSPTCSACKANWPRWQALLRAVGKGPVRFVFANTSPDPVGSRYICQHNIGSYSVLTTVDPTARAEYNLQLTPETIIITGAGKLRGFGPAFSGRGNSRR